MITIKVRISKRDLERLQRFSSERRVKDVFHIKWPYRYYGFAKDRFDRFSRGGGDWPPLAESTKHGRRGHRYTVLRDTGLLFGALEFELGAEPPGQKTEKLAMGVRVGFGGPSSYPDGTSIADIATFHQSGGPKLPKREIIVQPNVETLNAMTNDLEGALQEIADGR